MRAIVRFGVSLGVLGVSWCAVAAEESGSKADLAIHGLMRDLGVYELIREIPQTLNDGLEQRQSEQSDRPQRDWDRVADVVRGEFSEAVIAERIRASLKTDYNEARYAVLQRLMQSEVGQRLTQAKRAALTAQATEEIRKLARDHDDRTRDRERMTLLENLDDASADTEFFIAAQALSINALVRITDALDKTAPPMSAERKEVLLRASYEQLLRPSKFTTTMTYLHAFKSHSNDELQQYVELYRFGDMQWFLRRLMDALSEAMEQATVEAIQQLKAAR